ncbi:NADH-quinone oxidoreductase subunit C [Thermoactinospora rubra]|uniref:NADH-quinone oxidoreductase subunit C n=1 Tax=Thermoactinospora rubra TaxID=1088767 RepID=UPI001F0A7EE7|nr:NADH-quinone oxidoreductase subunit C [Thermoactinospora rubra]
MNTSIGQVSETFGEKTVDVERGDWITLLSRCRDEGYEFFDWLTGVDDPPEGFFVVAHVYNPATLDRLLLRTWVPRSDPTLPSAVGVYRGANWHERETFEMFGVVFEGHPHLVPLLLPEGFEGHPLRKEFILAARVAKPWPGAKEPGEAAPSRRKVLPPGVPPDWDAPSSTSLPAPSLALREGAEPAEPAEPAESAESVESAGESDG